MNVKTASAVLVGLLLLPGCMYHRVGDLNMVSTRNVDFSRKYVLLERYQKATVQSDMGALEKAIDKVVKNTPGGEFAMNVKIYVKGNGKKVRIEADVWGIPGAVRSTDGDRANVSVQQSINADVDIGIGDWVSWQTPMGVVTGQVVGMNSSEAMIQVQANDESGFPLLAGTDRKVSKAYEKLTKVSPPE